MAWSKVDSTHRKPFKWWVHKICCEWGWIVRNKDCWATYYHHLHALNALGFNLYGKKIK